MKESEKAHKAEVAESAAHDARSSPLCEIELYQIVKTMLMEDSEKDDVAALKASNEILTTENNALIQDKTTLTNKMELVKIEFDTIRTDSAASLKNINFQASSTEMTTLDRIQVNQHNAAGTEMPVLGKAGTSKTAEDGSSVEQHGTKRNVNGMKGNKKEN